MDNAKALIEQLQNGTRDQRRNAAIRLGRVRTDKCVLPLIGALKDDFDLTRVAAIQSLSWIGDERMIDPMLDVLHSDDSELVRKNVAEVLARLDFVKYPQIPDQFEKLLNGNAVTMELKEILNSALNK